MTKQLAATMQDRFLALAMSDGQEAEWHARTSTSAAPTMEDVMRMQPVQTQQDRLHALATADM